MFSIWKCNKMDFFLQQSILLQWQKIKSSKSCNNSNLAFHISVVLHSISWSCSETMLVTHYCQWAVKLQCLSYVRLSHFLATPLECYIVAPQCEKWDNANSSKWFIFSACSKWKSARVVSWGSILLSRAPQTLQPPQPRWASTVWRRSLLVAPG